MTEDKQVVLVVEDEPEMRAYLRTRLQRGLPQAEVVEAATLGEALLVLRERDVALVLSDHSVRGLDAFTLFEEARVRSPRAARVLMGEHAEGLGLQALDEGRVHSVFPKPLQTERLVATVERLLADRAPARRSGWSLVGLLREGRAAPPPRPPPRRCLVVDDVPQVARYFADVARRLPAGSVEVVVECDARAALERVRTQNFDVVVTDYRMRHVTGVDLLLAARTFLPAARRILVTGYNEVPERTERLRAADIHAYMHKPVPVQAALLLLRAALSTDRNAMETYRSRARTLEEAALASGEPLHLGTPSDFST